MFYYNYFDATFILVLIGLAISMAASAYVNHTFRKYDKIKSSHQVNGIEAAKFILEKEGITNVNVQQISGDLTDNYNSATKLLSLSASTAESTSVAAIGVAAHECGHAVQDHRSYIPLKLRALIAPVASIGSTLSFPIILIGIVLSWNTFLINIGIAAFSLALLFQLVTLPVEFNASRRALKILSDGELLTAEEVPMARNVLFAAALTYVAAALSTFLQLARLIILFGGNNRRD